MADQDVLREQVFAAMKAQAPIDKTKALEIADGILKPANPLLATQFRTWFDVNGGTLIEMING